ncbi:pyroglutamyl-peptidase I [Macrococcoides canis]|uniref:pyroglutamyl-peptidase I n=1 Tax=Macrococcoides canis TaxID=1855823 RepID=UPI001060279C|nr:pyroglutamyl-peptidase I [Macrococcus canis]TDM22268.1 pyroglutamyl-peptidase I [Macrococcus canis]TDM33054.1 pyroglutamyl-peptidase I [Macrococcus canis]TDM43999.1 pyroglutamyl-peptidase I [Macrococcus canis]
MRRVIVTGFDPFNNETLNPSFEAVRQLPDTILDAEIIKLELPTAFEKGAASLKETIMQNFPEIVICVGQAGGRDKISVEQVAINLIEARIPDNGGVQPSSKTIQEDGENAYFSNLPVKAMVKSIQDHEIPAEISYSAGTFVCNEIMYQLLYMIQNEFPSIRGGFIHVPFAPEQTDTHPSLPIATITEALHLAIEAALTYQEDIKYTTGRIH